MADDPKSIASIASLETKMDLMIKSIDEIKMYYVQKTQHDALEKRVDQLEHAPWKIVTIVLSGGSTLATIFLALYTIFHR